MIAINNDEDPDHSDDDDNKSIDGCVQAPNIQGGHRLTAAK